MTVHVVEPGGRGGVHQHAAALVAGLGRAGVAAALHTAADAETATASHPCFWRFARLRPRPARRAAVWAAWLACGIPSCLSSVGPGDVVDVEGWFRPAALVPLVAGARRRGARVALSPHNTFSRRGSPSEERTMAWMARQADAVVALSEHDARVVAGWGATPVLASLVVDPPAPDPAAVARWRARWGRRPVVLVAGQLRPDKGLDLAVQAAAGRDWVVAAVGEDLGGLSPARDLAAGLGAVLAVDAGYQPLGRFVAAVAAADVVACPYRAASSSAVLALAAALGRPSVATAIGGLPELASVAVPPGDPAALARGVERALRLGPVPPRPSTAVDAYLRAFGLVPA